MQTKRRYYIDRGEEKEDRSLYIFSKLTGEMSGWLLSKQKRLLAKSKGGKGKKKGGEGQTSVHEQSVRLLRSTKLQKKRGQDQADPICALHSLPLLLTTPCTLVQSYATPRVALILFFLSPFSFLFCINLPCLYTSPSFFVPFLLLFVYRQTSLLHPTA